MKLFVNSLMPLKCPGCDTEGMTHGLCSACWANLRIITCPMCKICGVPFQYDSNLLCAQCLKSTPAYDYCRAFAIYSDPIRSIITKLKQYSCPVRSEILARWIYSVINWNEVDFFKDGSASKIVDCLSISPIIGASNPIFFDKLIIKLSGSLK